MTKHTETPSHALPKLKPLVASLFTWVQRPGTLALTLGAMPALALANMPTGGKVVAGAATISNPDGNTTIINQASDKAVLNWQSFSIGEGGHVQFVQRDANSVALNRVVGSDPSSILGNLSANGQIFLVNQNGIFFGHSAKVDVAGIVATTLDIKDEDFMRGDYRFSRGANAPARATVINEGALNANGGYVVLAGDYAANKGIVQAQLGTVLLASGDSLTLQMAGSSLINYQVDKATVAHLAGVENSGQILANGGRVIMTADVAQDLASTVVNNSGLIQAQSAVEKNGAIYFEGNGGNVANSGTLDASAQAGANGGHVEIRASGDIAHEAGSKIDVSGAAEGVSDAGSVNTWADGSNRYKEGASIAARGGAHGGNGGDVELSGNNVVNRSIVDLSAAKGQLGTLTLDPLAITVADGAGTNTEDGATIYEQNLEAQLKVGNVSLLATGQDASITVADLSDGAIDGSNNGAGGSLTLRAEGSGNPSIRFIDRNDMILVDKAIDISTGDIEAPASGSIDVGHLNAGTRIDLASGSIRAASLTVDKVIDTQSDNSFAINARATQGNLTVDNDVSLNVRNLKAGALSTTVTLRADNGDVNLGAAVESKATGLGYYNYNWTTAGNDATTYYGAQPWTMVSQADHPILATLNIQAGGSVRAGEVNVLALDKNVAFDTTPGGYWQTATATQHNFWRATGAKAVGTVNAGADVTIAGKTSVKADGYATASYGETEAWRAMVSNFNYTSGSQTVITTRSDGQGGTTETRTTNNYNNVKGSVKGAGSERYIWSFGPYSTINGSTVYNSANVSSNTDSASGSDATAMSYTGVAGMSANLSVNAAGSVAMKGLEVRSTNRSGTGSGSFTDTYWGRQDTAANISGTGSSFTSAQAEIDYKDVFQTSYTAATSTANASISAGDNASVTIGEHSDVIAEHTLIDAATNNLAGATMSVSAGTNGGATGTGLVSIAGGVNVQGASGSDVSLTIRNDDGNIELTGADSSVTNTYVGADARAQLTANSGRIDTQGIAVSGGHAAYLDATAGAGITLAGTASTLVTSSGSNGAAAIRISAGGDVSAQDIRATSNNGQQTTNGFNSWTIDGGTASVAVQSSGGDIGLHGDVRAEGYESATISVAATGAGARLATDDGATVDASTNATRYDSSEWGGYYNQPTYLATTNLEAAAGIELGGDVSARLAGRNGDAYVGITTTGGKDAAIVQAAGTTIGADGARATVNIGAGAQSPNGDNGATVDLRGRVSAQARTDAAMITVSAAGGILHDFSAQSDANAASLTVNAVDNAGTLTIDGQGNIGANFDNVAGAALNVYGSGAVDAASSRISVSNFAGSSNAGARATLNANHGDLQLGELSVSGAVSAVVGAHASGALDSRGPVSAMANGYNGYAGISLDTTAGAITVADGGAVAASAYSNGSANLSVSSGAGLALNDDISAYTFGAGSARITATTATNAAIDQDAGTRILANGGSADISLTTGAFDLQGSVQASASSLPASLSVNGRSGSIGDFGVSSSASAATATINAANGDLTLAGNGNVNGAVSANLNATASGKLEVRGQFDTVQNGIFGTAQTTLVSSGGNLLVGADAALSTRANGMMANATLNLTGASGMTVEGDLAAAASGSAAVSLVTTGGSDAAIVQGADSAITANGNNATIGVKAGNGAPVAANAAALALAGSLQATGGTAAADIAITGAGGSVHSAIAQSSGAASVGIAAVGADARLAIDGEVRASANVNSPNGAELSIGSSGAIDTQAASLAAINLGGGAQAQLTALGDNALGALTVRGTGATANASAGGLLGVNGALLAQASGSGGQAQVTLTGDSATTVASGASVSASAGGAEGAAIVNLASAAGITVDGAVNATASGNGGDASINLLANDGDIALNAGLTSAASDIAAVGITGASGDIGVNANIDAIGGGAGTIALQALDGSLTQAAGATLHAGARNGMAQVDLASRGALRIDGDILAAATTNGGADGQHSGSATVNLVTTGGALSGITQDAGSTVEALGLSAAIRIAAGSHFPADDIANSAAFQLDGTLRAIDAMGGAHLEIAGASGSVHDFSVEASNAPANATITALRGDLVLDGNANVSGQSGGASLRVEANGALDTSAATVSVTNGGSDGADYADASFDAYGGNAKLGQTTVAAIGGAASLYAASTGSLELAADLGAISLLNAGSVDLSTTGGAEATLGQGAGTTIAARGGSDASVRISAGSSKAGARALYTLDGDIQAGAMNGQATIDIDGAGGSVHDFSVLSTRGAAAATITGVDSGASVVLDGSGSVTGAADDIQGAWLNVSSEGALDTSAATLSADNALAGESGGARLELHANGGNAVLGDASVSGTRVAALDASASGDLRVSGALASSANAVAGTATTDLRADGQAIIGAAGSAAANANAASGYAAVTVGGAQGAGVAGSLAAQAASQARINVTAGSGDVALDGALQALSARNASVGVNALDGKLTQSAAGTIHAGGGNGTGQVDLTSRGAMRVDGQVAAAATADGTVNGQHTGSAVANLTTTGGASASITQGAGSTIEAVGRAAYLTVKAGDSDMGRDASATAAFDLGGTLRAVDAIGGSRLAVGGASGRVHDFSVTAQNAPASAVFTAFNGDVVLDGTGNVVANTSNSAGASLRIDASGSIDTTAAQIGIANLSGDDGASAGAELYAQGSAKLGNLAVSANAAAQLTAMAGSDLTVAGRLSAAGTAAYGQAGIDLSAANAVTVGSTGVVNVTGGGTMGSASLNLDGSHGVNVAGSLNAYANEAAIGLQASAGNVVLDGALAAQGGDRASIEALAGGTLAQSAASRVHSGATNGVAEAYLSSTGAMTIAGRVSATATQDGSVDGAHSGAALVGLSTTGGASATVTQSAGSTIEAVGLAARLGIAAGSGSPVENTDKAAAFTLDGTLRAIDDFGGSTLEIAGASGSVHDFTVAAANATAKASITAVNGNLAFNGKGEVTGNAERSTGASLPAQAKGNIDTTAAVLSVANANAETASGAAATLQAGGNLALGPVSVTGANAALDASAAGKLDVMNTLAASGKADAGIKLAGEQGVTLGAALDASADRAYIDVTAASGDVALNSAVTALGGDRASVAVQALDGSLTQAAGTTITAGATSGVAEVDLSSSAALAVNGKILAAATADGTANGAHTGAALIGITTTGGAASSISQSQAGSIEAVGRAARLAINAGSANPADDVTKAAAFKLDGTLRAIDEMGGSSLQIAGASGSVHDFTVAAANATAQADIAAVNGDLVLTGTGTVSGNADEFDGASLKLSASGSIDTTGTTLKVSNVNSGEAAGAQAVLLASTGAAKLGVAKVTAQGGGTAAFQATVGTTLVVTAKLDAENLGLGTAAGNALVKLNTTGKPGVTSTVTQDSGATITASTKGNAGNATVDIQAGNCCNSAVVLNDAVKAVVDGGSGSATIAARGNTVTVKDLTANVLAAGTGNSMVSLAAPTEVKLAGTIDSQAASATARAQVQLVSDKLTDGATFKLSKGNGHVQLTPFSTGKIIGVHSDKDFDETADVNYNLVTLKKFMTQGAELTFGGEFDRSAWLDPVTGEVCLPGMEAWASQLQHTGAIHVAGNGRLNLGDVKMVFDTTGITTYHDPKLSAWSVPTGRVATLVVPPSNVDRYLDRTDNTVQNMNKVVQDTTATTRSSGAVEAGQLAPRGTQIGGKLFMDGNGVNMARNDAAEGSQADAQGPESKSRQNGDSTEQ